jgi:tRNA(fMet)-specific endonuclease VapC
VVDGLVVADSDLVIDFLRDREPGARRVQTWIEEGRLMVTAITAFELRLGAEYVERRVQIDLLLAPRILPLDLLGALHAGEAHAQLKKEGRPIDMRDALLAGICRRFDLPLATRNVPHFERVEGLRLVT